MCVLVQREMEARGEPDPCRAPWIAPGSYVRRVNAVNLQNQVMRSKESARAQAGLRDLAISWGRLADQVNVVTDDQKLSEAV
jgi:hypothetical protein